MTVYVIFYILVIVLFFVGNNLKISPEKNFYFLCFFSLLFCGLRSIQVGTDTENYYLYFLNPDNGFRGDITQELGYYWLNIILGYFIPSNYFTIIFAVISLFGVYYSISKLSTNKPLSVLLFLLLGMQTNFYLSFFSLIRQCVAISVFMIGISFIITRQQNKKKYYGFALLLSASLFHSSALLAVLLLILSSFVNIKTKSYFYLFIALSYIIGLFDITGVFTSLFPIFNSFGYLDRFSYVSDVGLSQMYAKSSFLIKMLSAPFALIGIYLVYKSSIKQLIDPLFKVMFISIVFNNIFWSNLMVSRAILYLSIFSIIVIPNTIKFKKENYLFYFFIFFYFVYKIFVDLQGQFAQLHKVDYNLMVPYKFLFE